MKFEIAVVIVVVILIILGRALDSFAAYLASLGLSGASAFARGCRDGFRFAKQ